MQSFRAALGSDHDRRKAIAATASTVYIVPCSKGKAPGLRTGRLPAESAYTGQAFRSARNSLAVLNLPWVILSGGYGFLLPGDLIADYEQRIVDHDQGSSWFEHVALMAKENLPLLFTCPNLVVLGSRHYASAAARILDRKVQAPFFGMPIGKMLQALSRRDWVVR